MFVSWNKNISDLVSEICQSKMNRLVGLLVLKNRCFTLNLLQISFSQLDMQIKYYTLFLGTIDLQLTKVISFGYTASLESTSEK